MDRSESPNEGGSSLDTVIGRSSSEDEKKRRDAATSADPAAVDGSSSSLDTAAGAATGEKKRGRFGALKNSFRKEGGIFKIKRKNQPPGNLERGSSADVEPDLDRGTKDPGKPSVTAPEKPEATETAVRPAKKKKKKSKKSHLLVRKLSLNKFRMSAEPEPRHTPEGGDGSRPLSQSTQESPRQSENPFRVSKKGLAEVAVEEKEPKKGVAAATTLTDIPVSTITVVQRESPQFTITNVEPEDDFSELLGPERRAALIKHFRRVERDIEEQRERLARKVDPGLGDLLRRTGFKSESESVSTSPNSSPSLHRLPCLVEEKRYIFKQCRLQPKVNALGEIISTTLDDDVDKNDEEQREENQQWEEKQQRKTRQKSDRRLDTAAFESAFDEGSTVDRFSGIEEDRSFEDDPDRRHSMSMPDSTVKARSISQDSASSQNNAASAVAGEKREHLYKILVIGELGAGKTSIIKRYVHQFFSQHYRATIGVDFALKVLNWDPHTIIRLQLWDIAGQERFGNMTRVYYKEAVGAFIVFDVTRSATLDAVVKWKQDLDSKVQLPDGSPIPCVLLANKCDQQKEGLVNSPAKMDEYCKEKNFAGWFETSAKENINIEEAARFLVNKILQNDMMMKGNESQDQNDGERFALNQSPSNSKKSCNC